MTRSPLPHNLAAEASVLGAILLSNKALLAVAELVGSEDFYHPTNAAIYRAMLALDQNRSPIDHLTVAEQMRVDETYAKLRAHNGEAYFAELMSGVASVENVAHHAEIVAGCAERRRAIEAAQQAQALAELGNDGWRDEATQSFFAGVTQRQAKTQRDGKALLDGVINLVDERFRRKQAVTGVPSGFAKLDALTCGFQARELTIVAARPSMGKTAFLGSIVDHACCELQIPTLVFSSEMDGESFVERLLSARARVDALALRTGVGLQQRDWVNLTGAAASGIVKAPLLVDDQAAPTLLQIRTRARRWRLETEKKHPLGMGLLGIDYLQLLGVVQAKGKSREQEVAELSRGLKALAKELGVPVIVLSQLNRDVDKRADKRPQLSDLRESGAIEQDADVITFLYRDEVYNPETRDQGIAEVIVAKQRRGPIGTVRLEWEASYTRFSEEEVKRRSNGTLDGVPPRDWHDTDGERA